MRLQDKVSAHFTYGEVIFSEAAIRNDIDNNVPEALIPLIESVALNVLEPLRNHFGVPFSPTSFYRCPTLNDAIGGAPSSQHTKGEAVDIKIPGISNLEVARWLRDNIKFDQLILECWDAENPTSGWVHCSFVTGRQPRGMAGVYWNKAYNWHGIP